MSPQTNPAKGKDTRTQLLDTGLRLFARQGFDAVSTRQLAQEAGVNIAAIAYHFGGKRELYRAVLTQLVNDTDPVVAPAAAKLRAALKAAGRDKQMLAGVVTGFVSNILRMFIEDHFMEWRGPLVMREYAMPSEDFDILYEGRIRPLHEILTKIVAAASDNPADEERAAVGAHTVMGQILVFGIARVILWRRLGWDGYTPERVQIIEETIVQSVLAALGLPSPAGAQVKGDAP
jgi:AcrR family transcriptional regulator